jgi:ubiquinone/menaquinone biosynthesis C-methylase UbiE
MDKKLKEYVKMAKAYHDKVAEEYDKPECNETLGYDELYNYITDKIEWYYIEKYLPSKGLVLDAAGGTARLAIPIAKKGLDVVIIDISEGMLKIAKKKIREQDLENRITLKQGDIHKIDYPDNQFDFVLAQGIEYCPDFEKVVAELARVLKPGRCLELSADSLFFVTWAFLNEKKLEKALQVLIEGKYMDNGDVWCWVYSPSQFREMCHRHNLKVEKIISGGGACAYIKDQSFRQAVFQNKKQLEKMLKIEMRLCGMEDTAILGSHPILIAKKR